MTERPKVTDQTACAHVGARPLRWSAVVVSRGLRAGAMDSTCHTRSTHAVPAAACAILGASLLTVGAVLMKPVKSSGISARIDGANGSIDPYQESNMKTSQAFRTAGALGVLAVTQIALVSGASAQSTAVQWRVADGGNGHWYELVAVPGDGVNRIPWGVARARSEQVGGHLATINAPEESGFIWSNFNDRFIDTVWGSPWCCWLGGYRASGQTFAWVTDEPYSCDSMPCGWPCEGGGENALYTGTTTGPNICVDYHYDSFQGGKPSYLVEFQADCNADNIVDFGQCLDGSLPDANANNIPDCCEQGIPCSPCYAYDLNPNGIVDGSDLGALLAFWGPVSPAFPRADINSDGVVSGVDLGLLLANWGPCGL